jgi:hypothetical protein
VNEETTQSPAVRTSNNAVSVKVTEEPTKPPPDEDESNPPIKEPPTEEPPVQEPPTKESLKRFVPVTTVGSAKTIQINRGDMMAVELRENCVKIYGATKIQMLSLNPFATITGTK